MISQGFMQIAYDGIGFQMIHFEFLGSDLISNDERASQPAGQVASDLTKSPASSPASQLAGELASRLASEAAC